VTLTDDPYVHFHLPSAFNTTAATIHHTAIIGHPPENRAWRPGDRCVAPRVHRTATIAAFVTVDAGAQHATTIGAGSWLMKHVHVGHDALIGEDCELAPHVVICGHVTVGDRVHIGVNATVLPYRTIGNDVVIGSGAVVTKDLPDGVTAVGNPARIIQRNPVPHTDRPDQQRVA
jgi:acyl-[acyl carrier protein]--UDP-N-acetylglucosamine O-acyltransferase